jgi:diguanylate cyclase (GGDEF)-like protein
MVERANGMPVAWCTTPDVRRGLERGLPGHASVTWTTPDDPFANDVATVLDTRAFESTSALLAARHARPACPVLVVCAEEDVTALVAGLEVSDDVALHDTPPALLAFRLGRLFWANPGRDSLTGLFNRSVLVSALQHAIEDPDRMPLSLVLVDVDRFKDLNDTFGHALADEFLKEAAAYIIQVVPSGAVVARLGGDQFAMLHTSSPPEAVAVAEQIRCGFEGARIRGLERTVSVGCATASAPGQSLYRPASEALYAAKAKGRNAVVHYDEIARRALEQDRDPAFESFENHTRVFADRIAELITRRGRRLFEGLKQQADVDGLTGLFSRRYLDRRLAFEVEVASDQSTPLTVGLLDLDYFGAVNKLHGFPTGDRVLSEVAARIRANTREEDWVARYGGEEICIVMHGTSLELARPVLERIRSALAARPFSSTAGNEMEITLSGGAAQLDGAETLDNLMERVSRNLLLAKEGGRNRIVT